MQLYDATSVFIEFDPEHWPLVFPALKRAAYHEASGTHAEQKIGVTHG
jgi:hypothetical protein